MDNIGKWYTFTEYYNEEGVKISKKEALKNYIITNKTKHVKKNGNTGTITWWIRCEKNRQLRLF